MPKRWGDQDLTIAKRERGSVRNFIYLIYLSSSFYIIIVKPFIYYLFNVIDFIYYKPCNNHVIICNKLCKITSTLRISLCNSLPSGLHSLVGHKSIANLTSLDLGKGFVKLQQLDRIIDGYDATSAKFKDASGGVTYLAVFNFPVQFKYYDFGSSNEAAVRIIATNYTDYEFDRLVDTFKIDRLVSRQ